MIYSYIKLIYWKESYMNKIIKIASILLISSLLFQSKTLAQTDDYWDKETIDAAYKKELIDLGFKDGKYLDLKNNSNSHHPYVVVNNVIHTAEVAALRPDGTHLKGRVPSQVSQEQLLVASKLSCVGAINVLKDAAGGDLSKIRKVANIRYLTLSDPEYIDYALVSNECSTLMVRVFGQTVGSHTRFAIGLVSSPNDLSFKLNLIAYLK